MKGYFMTSNIDPITLEIMRNALYSIADEMTAALLRTAYSTNIKDRRDCSCALCTAAGDVVAQTELGTPFHLGVLPAVLEVVLEKYPLSELNQGDAVITNNLYPIGPGHLSDITVVSPIYYDGEIVALAATMAHHVDVGGYAPGSMPFGVTEVYQEGLQIPPVKIMKQGELDEELMSIITQNVRTKAESRGDTMAQVAANNVAKKRVNELMDKYGKAKVLTYMDEILNYAERSMRAGIRRIPDGKYSFSDYLEGDGETSELIEIKVMVEVEGEHIRLDFTETADQVKGPMNSRQSSVRSCVYYVLKSIIDPDLPTNSGAYRPIEVITREGSILQASFPAALCNANILTAQRVVDVLLGALIEAVPERVVAACSGEMNLINVGGINPRTKDYYNYVETYGGGQGAMHNQDGMDGVHTHMTNTRNAPVEVIESTYPLRVEKYGLVEDSEGAGMYRGGLGMTREFVMLSDETKLTLSADRRDIGPWGVFLGFAARTSDCIITSPDGQRRQLPSKITTTLSRNDKLTLITPGGGGWGSPKKRDPKSVQRDVAEGFISIERARNVYAVVIDPKTFQIDLEATAKLRDEN